MDPRRRTDEVGPLATHWTVVKRLGRALDRAGFAIISAGLKHCLAQG